MKQIKKKTRPVKQNYFIEKINKIGKTLPRLTKNKQKRPNTLEAGDIDTYSQLMHRTQI